MNAKTFLIATIASASLLGATNLVLAQTLENGRSAYAQGEAINLCRAQEDPMGGMRDDHHERLATEACVQRLFHGQ
jgi:hypothetical protein